MTVVDEPLAMKRAAAAALAQARAATEQLIAPVSDEELTAQVSPLMSPLVWDLAHIGYFEELWLLRELGVAAAANARFDDLYDAFRHERRERGALPLLSPDDTRAFLADVRQRVLAALDDVDANPTDPLLRDGFVYGLVVQHELQHQETMLQTLQLSGWPYPTPVDDDVAAPPEVEEVFVASGTFTLGASDAPWAYDNERPARTVEVGPFLIESYPVTNARYVEFIESGGYRDRRWWSDDGWRWVQGDRAEAPLFWRRAGGDWTRVRFGRAEPVPAAEPVQHVSFFEAEAFACWVGKRLPTEIEWERAAQGARAADANLGRAAFAPLPVSPRATSSLGCHCMLGDVWEWTSSPFVRYPGFTAFPYREYSEVFFGDDYRVLRGGSWATDPLVARVTFRNWDYPIRRQIFSGIRLAQDV